MRSAFLDRPNGPIIAAACDPDGAIRAVQECSTHTLFLGTRLNWPQEAVHQSRRCGDDSHPGEEIYTPSGDEAKGTRLHKGCLRVTDFLSSQTVMSANVFWRHNFHLSLLPSQRLMNSPSVWTSGSWLSQTSFCTVLCANCVHDQSGSSAWYLQSCEIAT